MTDETAGTKTDRSILAPAINCQEADPVQSPPCTTDPEQQAVWGILCKILSPGASMKLGQFDILPDL